ncbi:Glucose-6-phosphate 1-dehydrogenase [Paraburkholderia domus]|jgi:glucose-6-phosphate 1-dehydrogenase|uniref:Glucose-6-phosphate 1-dehydrogenase n=1 Tax=Paraburkholderia domus TaxID=2793075 RepID=A0A9N8QZE1_9BURK|nr:glucose-6-phosphate dehydrogenase [Paraburkholderia domus]MBK5051321.1 glucose-6-phosphate dehydrogenase [Burkholderia sp. R-70006]MBK5061581.1 glucose-6-phosphate dehydrogenase [Burkholderia sp. R-70199]MBK5088344.1 glucose-6-phosphate dehydrogenase [Burkholderia sp. R-69927]MBK5122741.1 glucose-6-phosphate dehydrogenase [Burkholderia sp. R-69980]MBK5165391.1 glucose-6-phosphate dehydrogenase [Burkholderia sp. R-70211]MBK5185679.1 glucose-6-phosphate dehydrogenase [Burkholderia sp. R-6974
MTKPSPRELDHPPFAFVLFGGTGDLAMRKILPALYAAHRDGLLAPDGRIVSVAQTALDTGSYLRWVDEHVKPHIPGTAIDDSVWRSFRERIAYVALDASQPEAFFSLGDTLGAGHGRRIFYLATGPALFVPICRALASAGLTEGSRVVLEKPLGYDLESSNAINDAVGQIFKEDQIYRIDHYLGKEAVQNLLALRFGNSLFEPLWRREWVESIQITVAEELGVEGRGNFYDQTGALRDMVQNHLLQLLSIIAMEPPQSMDADAVRDEKLRVLRALKPVLGEEIRQSVVRGQYHAGAIKDTTVSAYHAEPGVRQGSTTETFVALKVEVENWRWAGVPFFLRTGKRLAGRIAEIVVNFKPVPHSALGAMALRPGSNRLTIRLQPNESIRLSALAKQPGMGMTLQGVHLDLAFDQFFQQGRMEAYQRLLLDVIAGRLALFVRRDEQEAAWRWVAPIIEDWATQGNLPKPYASGTWGPAAASALLARHNTCWQEEEN